MNRSLAVIASALCLLACHKDAPLPALIVGAGCQPLLANVSAAGDCLMPFPSDFFRVADSSMPSGFRLDSSNAGPATTEHLNTDINVLFHVDGASEVPVLATTFPEPLSATGFVKILDDPTGSTQPSSNVLIIEADNGTLIPHFVDLDPQATDPKRQAIVIHPIVALKAGTRYVVAMHGVQHPDGTLVGTPEGFRRLRDGVASNDPALSSIAAHFASDILPIAVKAGIAQSDLQMAWDFTVGSDARRSTDMLQVRKLTVAWLAENTPSVTVDTVTTQGLPSDTWMQIGGTVTGPLFLADPNPEAQLNRDSNGNVVQNGTVAFPYTVQVPAAVRDQFGPALTMAYGHGFFGKRDEVTYDSTRNIGTQLKAVLFGIDWWGMDFDDGAVLAGNLADHPAKTLDFADRVHQGMANWMVMTAAIRTVFPGLAQFQRPASGSGFDSPDGGAGNAGACIFDSSQVVYLGISQGAILGGTMTTLNPDFHRIILHMGAAGFSQLMSRAAPFGSDFLPLLDLSMPDPFEQQKFIATLQPQFDRFDPATYVPMLLKNTLEGTPADRTVLMQNGLGDDEVSNLGTFLEARVMGMPLLTPSPTEIFEVSTAAMPSTASGLAFYDFGIDLHAQYDLAEPATYENGVHNSLREATPALQQMAEFYASGTIADFCDGGVCLLPCPAAPDSGLCTR